MVHPASRVLAMLELLQAHRRMTVGELASRLAVDERTVRRYAGTLADLGIPVAAERGRYGGYRLAPGFKLPPLMLTDDEAVAVVLGLVAAERIGLGTPAASSAEAKISRVLPDALSQRLAGLRESLGFTMRGRSGQAADSSVLLSLGAAVRDRDRQVLAYNGERAVDPYGLVVHSGRWYLIAHDHRRGEVRTFRVDRVEAVRPLGVRFEPPEGFDAVAHFNLQWAQRDYRWAVEVLVHAPLPAVQRHLPANVAVFTETSDGVLMAMRAENLRGMAAMLAGLNHPFTVIEPDELRPHLPALATDLAGWAVSRPAPGTPAP
ncbi:YafY family protein, partial [Actinoplanes sp. NPDC051633]|uniref:helix-turn-helix transcriptional regulator n=1 Tax=Actinoplanes sp. NPDC051633 TaxID=3155670 RepID=UPI0034234103